MSYVFSNLWVGEFLVTGKEHAVNATVNTNNEQTNVFMEDILPLPEVGFESLICNVLRLTYFFRFFVDLESPLTNNHLSSDFLMIDKNR